MNWFKNNKRDTRSGQFYEALALKHLKQHGLKLLDRNYASKYGEIDLVMQDKDTLVFVEVRRRKHDNYGTAIESVDYQKQTRIANTAENYLQKHPWSGPCRFDIVAIQGKAKPQWLIGAFDSP